MRVVVIQTVFSNGGDAAIALGMRNALFSAYGNQLDLTYLDAQPAIIEAFYQDVSIGTATYTAAWPHRTTGLMERVSRRLYWFSVPRALKKAARMYRETGAYPTGKFDRVLAQLKDADLVIATGGTYLIPSYWLGPRLLEFEVPRLMGKPIALFTQSLGPFTNPRTRKRLSSVFSDAILTLVRDPLSKSNVLDVAPEANVEIRADAAFALAEESVLVSARSRTFSQQCPVIGISVREWSHFKSTSTREGMDAYKSAMSAFVAHLVTRHNAQIRFVSTCQGIPEYRYDDSEVAAEIVSALPEEIQANVTIIREYLRPERVMEHARQCDLVVATRMHMAILSLCAGTPVLPIAYEFKTSEVFKRLGMSEFVQEIESLTVEQLISGYESLVAALPGIRRTLLDQVEHERQDAMASGRRIKEAFEGAAL